jgi:PAS domain S-box-containing protein
MISGIKRQPVTLNTPRSSGGAWPVIAALVIAIGLVVSINVLWWRLDLRATEQADLVDHTHQVIAALEETVSRASDMLIGQRGFALTHDPEYLQPFFEATNRMPVLLASLHDLTEDNPRQRHQLNRLQPLLEQHERISRDHLESLLKGDPLAPDLPFRRAVKESVDNIRAITDAMIREEDRLLVERRAILQHDSRLVTLANLISGAVSAGLLIAVFTALWRENKRRRLIESELRVSQEALEDRVRERTVSLSRSEERLRLAHQAARIGSFEWNARTEVDTWTPELEAMYGLTPGGFARTLKAWEKLVHPDDRADAVASMKQALETGLPTEGEWRVIWPDGSVHWLFGRWQAFKDESGQVRTMTGVNIDITERKRLEREIIEASDSEMRRIGHDLHDGIGQQLTALALFHASLQRELQAQTPQFADSFQKIGRELHEITRQIRVLSHGLSPISFEGQGLVEALRKLAADTSSIAMVDCRFEEDTIATFNDAQTAAQFYRIGQEAVTNALKHSRARQIRIRLEIQPDRWQLAVRDDGQGFSANNGAGLGLRAMKYRAAVVGAALRIDSKPGQGTEIVCTLQRQT